VKERIAVKIDKWWCATADDKRNKAGL